MRGAQAPLPHTAPSPANGALPLSAVQRREARRALLLNGVVVGLGLAGNLDQIILHELLQWHVFFVHTGPFWQRFIDGLFHLATVGVLVAGLAGVWAWQRRYPGAWRPGMLLAGVLLGLGGFNIFDGTVNHKVLRLHQVREGVADLWRYDVGYLALAVLIFIAGWVLWRREARHS